MIVYACVHARTCTHDEISSITWGSYRSHACLPPVFLPRFDRVIVIVAFTIAVLQLFPPPAFAYTRYPILLSWTAIWNFIASSRVQGKTVILFRSLLEKRVTFAITYPAYPPFYRLWYYAAINSLTFTLAPWNVIFLFGSCLDKVCCPAARERRVTFNVKYLPTIYFELKCEWSSNGPSSHKFSIMHFIEMRHTSNSLPDY